jgi:hypothetical protein
MRPSARGPILIAMRIDVPDATFTNGRYELPRSARGVLVLADPPEAGWRLHPPASKPATALGNTQSHEERRQHESLDEFEGRGLREITEAACKPRSAAAGAPVRTSE